MPSIHQINYLAQFKSQLTEPILIVGAKEYGFDHYAFVSSLQSWGLKDITGIDISAGPGVDQVVDICEEDSLFVRNSTGKFGTIICMQVLYATVDPFAAARNVERLLTQNGHLVFSDVFSHRIHRIPTDYWRFTYDAHKLLFKSLVFDDEKARLGITRSSLMIPLQYPFPEILQHQRHDHETKIGFFVRRLHRKLFANGIFTISRFLPELSIFSFATKVVA